MAQVNVTARPSGGSLQASQSNSLLDLAQSLSGVNHALTPVLQNYAKDQEEKLGAKAHADALSNHGDKLADAVRDGRLKPTQNPWYVQAYDREAATVRGQGEVSALVEESQTWSERNDAQAFQAKFTSALGKIGQTYQGPDQQAGFTKAAEPLLQQTLQQNVQYNVQRIQQERAQNIGTLATTAIIDLSAKVGGHPSAKQVWDVIEEQHLSWIKTGGTEAQWNTLTINSVIAAATNSENPDLLNILQDNREGKGALANIVGPTGSPVAGDISQAKHYIEQALENKGLNTLRQQKAKIEADGINAEQMVWDHYGYQFISGKIGQAEVSTFLQQQGATPQAAAYVIKEMAEQANASNALGRALVGLKSADPETALRVLDIYTLARTKGLSPELDTKLEEAVRSGLIDYGDAKEIQSTAQSRSDHLDSEARQDARSAKSDATSRAASDRSFQLQAARDAKDDRTQAFDSAVVALERLGDKSLSNDPSVRGSVQVRLNAAQGAYLRAHPGDYLGAKVAVETELNAIIAPKVKAAAERAKRTGQGTSPSVSPSSNPRR